MKSKSDDTERKIFLSYCFVLMFFYDFEHKFEQQKIFSHKTQINVYIKSDNFIFVARNTDLK
jgi:hypothetical protein